MSPRDKETDVRLPDGFFPGEKVGHVDGKSHIRKPDGFFRGEEVGYVDERNQVRRRDGFFRGQVVGQVKGDAAHGKDGFFAGQKWGYVDEHGNVRVRDGFFRGRIVGAMRGNDKAGTLGYFLLQFDKLEARYAELAREYSESTNRMALLSKVHRMLEYLPEAKALGDFDGLMDRLRRLERDLLAERDRHQAGKEELCSRAEKLSESSDWKGTAEELKQLQARWKSIGSAGRDLDDRLWARFRGAQDRFFARRKAYFEQQDKERQSNRSRKEALCARAEAMASSSDWKATGESLKALQSEWKGIRGAGREVDDALWARFRAAQDRFFARRKSYADEQESRRSASRARKEALCGRAEALSHSTDWKTAAEALKSLQADWKAAGPAGRDHDDQLWNRFRAAQDRFFQRRTAAFESRDRELRANLSRKEGLCAEVEYLASNVDRDSPGRVKELQARWKSIGHVPKSEADALWDRFRRACDLVFARVGAERERRQELFGEKMRDALSRKREQFDRIRESIEHDISNIERWQSTISNLKPGGRAAEIAGDLIDRIDDVRDRIRSKRSKLDDLAESIRDIQSKL